MHWRPAVAVGVLLVMFGVGHALGPRWARAQGATPSAVCPVTAPAENAALVRDYSEEVSNGRDAQRAGAFLADDFMRHDPGLPPASQSGLDDDVALTAAQLADFPDLRVRIDDLIAADDRVVARLTWRGTELAPLEPWGYRRPDEPSSSP